MITVEFLITSLIVVLIPGTGVVLTVSIGPGSRQKGERLRSARMHGGHRAAPGGDWCWAWLR